MAIVVLAVAAGPTIYFDSVAADLPDYDAEYEKLESAGNEEPTEWLQLARNARAAEDIGVAGRALDQADRFGLGAVRVGIEKSRILIAGDDPAGATAELAAVFAAGFTSVGVLTSDSVINTLAGNKAYDDLVVEMSVQAYPCAHQAGFRDFDFWIGEWDVHVANGTLAGSNVIKSIERGCALTEQWTNAAGGTGSSINYFDKSTDEWVQIWNAEGGSQINIRGGLTDDGMAMEGFIYYVGADTSSPFRALWTPLPDGRVRQYFEQSNDGGKSWVPWFEGFYTRSDK
jgi:hypothetical protein